MSTSGYEIAFTQATTEITEIDEQLKQLHARKILIDNLLECLTALVPQLKPTEETNSSSESPSTALSIVEAPVHHEAQSNENHQSHEHHEHQEHHEYQEHHG